MPIQSQESFTTPNRQDQKRAPLGHIVTKPLNTQRRERVLKTTREKHKVRCEGSPPDQQQISQQKSQKPQELGVILFNF